MESEVSPAKVKEKKAIHWVEGPISPLFIADSIAKHSGEKNIGAHSIFLGQVRNDQLDGKTVHAIEYSSYRELAEKELHNLREEIFKRHKVICMHILHSLGRVNAGEICLFVFVSSAHRKEANDACREIVEGIKKKVPIWGKIVYEDDTYTWKKNRT